jgi:hypothetical protein
MFKEKRNETKNKDKTSDVKHNFFQIILNQLRQ